MNKFEWIANSYVNEENLIYKQDGVSLLDGVVKSSFNNGCIEITTHRLIWYDPKDVNYRIGMKLKMVKSTHLEKGGFGKSNYVEIKLYDHTDDKVDQIYQSPVSNSLFDFIRIIFKKSGESGFLTNLNETLNNKAWVIKTFGRGKGILGIERNIQKKSNATDTNIEIAFSDLDKLMNQAKLMVNLCKSISQKISEKEEFNTDETIQFKSYLLSMGISDPVTRRNCSTSQTYFEKLAIQITDFLREFLPQNGGMMSSTDVFCRINRARGMELLSPEDLIEAGKLMAKLKLDVILKIFDSGVMVFQSASLTDEKNMEETISIVENHQSMTPEKLSRILHIPPILSKERLLLCESNGKLCRDDTVEGLKFFPNKFMDTDKE